MEKGTELWDIPAKIYQSPMSEPTVVAHYTNGLLASRFSEVMWRIEQLIRKSMDKWTEDFLLWESSIEGSLQLKISHETITNHLGSHRELIIRILRNFKSDGMVTIFDAAKLKELPRQPSPADAFLPDPLMEPVERTYNRNLSTKESRHAGNNGGPV